MRQPALLQPRPDAPPSALLPELFLCKRRATLEEALSFAHRFFQAFFHLGFQTLHIAGEMNCFAASIAGNSAAKFAASIWATSEKIPRRKYRGENTAEKITRRKCRGENTAEKIPRRNTAEKIYIFFRGIDANSARGGCKLSRKLGQLYEALPERSRARVLTKSNQKSRSR